MQVDHTKNIIEAEDVSFAYGHETVLEHITLDIHQGDYIGIIGPNGAGKTTLLKIMLGLIKPDSGRVKLFGEELKNFKAWHKIGYVSQKPENFDANFPATVEEVVAMGRYAGLGIFKNANREGGKLVQAALEQVDMQQHRDRLIGDLSGGELQRVFIARALVNRPEVLFLDEPTTGVDSAARDSFYRLLQKLNKEMGLTLVLVSHDIERLTKEVMHIACVDRSLTCHMSPEEYIKESRSAKISGQDVKIIGLHHHN